MSYEVIAVEYFRRRLKKLSKKYRGIGEDYKSLLETLEKNPSEGDAIPGFGNKIYKIRMRSSDMKRGKRGGFRVIYYLSDRAVYLLTIYAKAKKEEISVKEIKEAMRELDINL
ncbi:MAG: type II toxin-antitoxin system RelE/ParE family toxin [Euryarchaeota archaeon]|nr:type II toxin-antitoxin system RelE/ParE family toxin [Euryarchaeota archaeon]